ncbi:MAG TPA: amino acid adenylation domain-containing protein, partial [Anaerolineae bacterium]|nr:amino acid adenylation domain-containing protein [Anaerolineae bacterium]
PFEMLVEALNIERNLSHTPLFQVMFSLGNTPMTSLTLPGLTLTPLETDTRAATFDLTLAMNESPEGLQGSLEYNTDLFDPETMERLIGHFQALLTGIAAAPDTTVTQLPLLTETEWQQIEAWNDTAVPLPENRCVHHLIAAKAAQTPDAIALVHDGEQWSYRRLNQRANQLAHHLLRRGVQPDDLVGVMADRSPQMIVALLGILKAGAAYLPLDPDYPAERLAYMLADAQPKLVLQTADHSTLTTDYPTINLSHWEEISQEADNEPETAVTPDNLAYVIYTSGSTGQPKGVMIPHRGLLNHNLAVIDLFELTATDRVWQFATINFDTAVEEIFPTLISGATLVLRGADIPPVADLCPIIAEQQLTILDLPTAYWHAWAHDLAQSGAALPGCLRLVVVGGEKVETEGLRLWQEVVGDTAVTWLNTYGPTETTVIATAYKANGRVTATVPIGRPIANTQTWVLDPHGQPVPVSVPGELHIGGSNLARGYLNRPDLTAEKFVQFSVFSGQFSVSNPLNTENCTLKTAYRTGDLVRYLPDGNLEFLGRVDRQVKIRGFRVELGEIEAVLNRHPRVREGVVIVWEDGNGLGPKQLVAYFTAAAEPAPTTSELRRFLGETLPEYMIPAAFIPLEQMPLTPSGKIDRRALPEPDNLRPDLAAAYVPPRTPTEEQLANIWQELLRVEQVGVYDNFFELGGHSLLATQLISRLRHLFPTNLSLRALFEAPTIAGLAEQITLAQQSANGRTIPPIQPAPPDTERPLSFAQQRMWFLHQLDPDSPEYNIPDVVRLRGRLDLPALEESVNAIIRRHETLRTVFLTVDGQPQLSVADDLTITNPVIDLRHLPPAEREAEAMRRAEAEAVRPFDLTTPPLLRLTLLQLDEEEYLALLTMHHIIADGWSMGVFIQELAAGYTAVTQNQPLTLPDLPIQYSDFAWWQRNWLQGDPLEEQLDYWREKLAGAPPLLELPTDHPRPAV